MSLLVAATPKDCSKQGLRFPKLNKKLLYTVSSLHISLLFLIFLLSLTLHPSKPEFYLKDTAVYQLALFAAPASRLLNSTIQTIIVSCNPNSRVGIYYDWLRTYTAYKGQQITADAVLPPF
ncbi:hypothetical protein Cni_G09198 [Canna indica]|uniref:Uncharacterized protein n=1 Tax=Canna indica TaxID=4628 RepID=A0AAQ3K3W2_9LILI|nr:hypothetical protein Cni_G09198 [Canna indica]